MDILDAIAGSDSSDRALVGALLLELSWLDTPESRQALIDMFRSGKNVSGLEEVWGEIIESLRGPDADALCLEWVRRRVSGNTSSADATPLWRACLRRLGESSEADVASLLSSSGLAPDSMFRTELLAAIDRRMGDTVHAEIVRQLENPTMAMEAFGALVRMGDAPSRAAALEHLLQDGPYAFRVAEQFGPSMGVEDAARLRTAAAREPKLLSTYLAAVCRAPPAVLAAEADTVRAMAVRALNELDASNDPNGFRRTEATRAIDAAAATIASPDVLRAVLAGIRRSPSGRRDLVSAARKMQAALGQSR